MTSMRGFYDATRPCRVDRLALRLPLDGILAQRDEEDVPVQDQSSDMTSDRSDSDSNEEENQGPVRQSPHKTKSLEVRSPIVNKRTVAATLKEKERGGYRNLRPDLGLTVTRVSLGNWSNSSPTHQGTFRPPRSTDRTAHSDLILSHIISQSRPRKEVGASEVIGRYDRAEHGEEEAGTVVTKNDGANWQATRLTSTNTSLNMTSTVNIFDEVQTDIAVPPPDLTKQLVSELKERVKTLRVEHDINTPLTATTPGTGICNRDTVEDAGLSVTNNRPRSHHNRNVSVASIDAAMGTAEPTWVQDYNNLGADLLLKAMSPQKRKQESALESSSGQKRYSYYVPPKIPSFAERREKARMMEIKRRERIFEKQRVAKASKENARSSSLCSSRKKHVPVVKERSPMPVDTVVNSAEESAEQMNLQVANKAFLKVNMVSMDTELSEGPAERGNVNTEEVEEEVVVVDDDGADVDPALDSSPRPVQSSPLRSISRKRKVKRRPASASAKLMARDEDLADDRAKVAPTNVKSMPRRPQSASARRGAAAAKPKPSREEAVQRIIHKRLNTSTVLKGISTQPSTSRSVDSQKNSLKRTFNGSVTVSAIHSSWSDTCGINSTVDSELGVISNRLKSTTRKCAVSNDGIPKPTAVQRQHAEKLSLARNSAAKMKIVDKSSIRDADIAKNAYRKPKEVIAVPYGCDFKPESRYIDVKNDFNDEFTENDAAAHGMKHMQSLISSQIDMPPPAAAVEDSLEARLDEIRSAYEDGRSGSDTGSEDRFSVGAHYRRCSHEYDVMDMETEMEATKRAYINSRVNRPKSDITSIIGDVEIDENDPGGGYWDPSADEIWDCAGDKDHVMDNIMVHGKPVSRIFKKHTVPVQSRATWRRLVELVRKQRDREEGDKLIDRETMMILHEAHKRSKYKGKTRLVLPEVLDIEAILEGVPECAIENNTARKTPRGQMQSYQLRVQNNNYRKGRATSVYMMPSDVHIPYEVEKGLVM